METYFDTDKNETTLTALVESAKGHNYGTLVHNPATFAGRKKRRNCIAVIKRAPRGPSIEMRPIEIADRNTFGHWEMDCVCGSSRSCLLVLTERLTRYEIIYRMQNQTSKSVLQCLNKLERKFGKTFVWYLSQSHCCNIVLPLKTILLQVQRYLFE